MDIMGTYHYLNNEISDPRVSDWLFMSNPFSVTLILFIYLSFVLYLGPHYMKDRKPYTLRKTMMYYNIFISVANAVVFYGALTSGFTTHLSLGCEPLVISNDSMSLSMARWMWMFFFMKIIELGDTVIFIFRKKYNQTSFFHIYHHTVTVIVTWITSKYAPGGMWTFPILPNSAVHVIMYMYYFSTGLGPKIQKIISPWKKYMTSVQMTQLIILLIHTFQAFLPSCEPTRKPLACIYVFHLGFTLYLFLDFYRKSYLKKKIK